MTTTYNTLAISSQRTLVPWQGGAALRLRERGRQGNVLPQRVESPPRTSLGSQSISRVLLPQPCHQSEQPLGAKSKSCSSLVNLGLSWLLTILAWWGLICLLLWISWWTHWQCSTKVGVLTWQTRKPLPLLALVSNCTQRCPFDQFPHPICFLSQAFVLLNFRYKSSSTGAHGPKVQVWGASATWCWGACQGKGASEIGGWQVRKNLSTNILFVFGLSQVLFYSFRQDMLCPPAWASSLKERVLKAGSIFTFNPGLKMEKQKKKLFFMYANLLRSDIMNYWSRYLVNFLHG